MIILSGTLAIIALILTAHAGYKVLHLGLQLDLILSIIIPVILTFVTVLPIRLKLEIELIDSLENKDV